MPVGERYCGYAPLGHHLTQTFIAGLRSFAMVAPWLVDAPMNKTRFEFYLEHELAPTLKKADVVILDNLPVHKSPRAEEIIRDRGAWMLFLPPYSPDLNPIEMAFCQAQGPSQKGRSTIYRCYLRQPHGYLQYVRSHRMQKLLSGRRI
ncbi:transposase [Rhizobium sp. SG_E_25_P2]|uniref:transposase n=1 Tax=Rhizobium sp. SG_E_25_P2 TaxID=2879942 RepID=UPI0024735FEF|nr:transposase [Rhizobium sp. SG_E_25_P2]